MKFIIIGFGNFGVIFGLWFVEDGYEVIGVDKCFEFVNLLKDGFIYIIELDIFDEFSMDKLLFEGVDIIFVMIGEDIGVFVIVIVFVKER